MSVDAMGQALRYAADGWSPGDAAAKFGVAEADVLEAIAARMRPARPNGYRPESPAQSVDAGWEQPVPVDAPPLPVFPVRHLLALAPMVEATAEALQVPVDLAALTALTVVAAAVGGRCVVQVREDWREPLALYSLALLPSGERKSAVVKTLARPLVDAERLLVDEALPGIRQHAQNLRIAKQRLDECEKQAAKPGAKPDAMAKAVQAREDVDRTGEPPAAPRLWADDATPEELARLAGEQGGRMAVISAEGGLFGILAGRYSGGTPNLEFMLKAHSGDPVRVDRVGRAPVLIPEPCVTVCLAAQPALLAGLAAKRDNGFRASGLLARFLYAIPPGCVGQRLIDPQPIPAKVRDAYEDTVGRLVREVWGSDSTCVLTLSQDAAAGLRQLRAALEPRLGPGGDLAAIADWGSKLPGALVRLAGLLCLTDDPAAHTIQREHMAAAIGIADYLIAHARRAFDLLHGDRDSQLAPARAVLAWLRREPRDRFTAREAHRALNGQAWLREPPGGLSEAERVRSAIADLEGYGWVVAEQHEGHSGPGRPPSAGYLTHPQVGQKR